MMVSELVLTAAQKGAKYYRLQMNFSNGTSRYYPSSADGYVIGQGPIAAPPRPDRRTATAALASYIRNEDDLERRLRNARDEAEGALDLIRDMNGHGGVIRSRLPAVMDAQDGLSIASQQQTAPSVVPSSAPSARPDLTTSMESGVADLSWPPQLGEYAERGLVKQAGELTASFLAMTYEEVRAFVLGLTQPRSPSREAKV